MRTMGWVLVAAGIIQMAIAGGMSVSLPNYSDTANLDLIAQRAMVFQGGGFAFVSGVIALAAARIAKTIQAKAAE